AKADRIVRRGGLFLHRYLPHSDAELLYPAPAIGAPERGPLFLGCYRRGREIPPRVCTACSRERLHRRPDRYALLNGSVPCRARGSDRLPGLESPFLLAGECCRWSRERL